MSSAAAEKKIKKLARLYSNTVCANCGITKKFGFSTVCIKYFTFVCNNCKSSHQAISHRCKSLTMSSWTDAEVAELERKGNDYARRTWLKNAPPIGQGGRPKEGDHIDVFKRFVVDAYERKRYYDDDEGDSGTTSGHHTHVATAVSAPRVDVARARVVTRAPVRKPVPAPTPTPSAPVKDLLDFASMSLTAPNNGNSSNKFEASFDAFAPMNPTTISEPPNAQTKTDPFNSFNSQTAAAASKGSSNAFEANFDAFAPVTSVTKSEPSANSKKVLARTKTDPFNSLNSGSSNSFKANFDAFSSEVPVAKISSSSNDTKSTTTNIGHDPFQPKTTHKLEPSNGSSFNFINNNNTIATPLPAQPAMKKPVMNNHTLSQNSCLISSMSMPAPNSNMQNGNLNMGMGWNSNNRQNFAGGMGNMQMSPNQMMMQQQQMNMMNGRHVNNNGMCGGMMNSNNSMMMMTGGINNPMMMNQQQTMMNGNNFSSMMVNANGKSKSAMHSLHMNSSSMSAWSAALNK